MAVAVVVDARNVHGFLGRLLDQPVVPSVAAVVESLAGYGLRPVSVSVGVAIAPGRSGSEALRGRSERNRLYAEAIDAHPLGRAVRGVPVGQRHRNGSQRGCGARALVGAYALIPRRGDWRVVDPADAKHHDELGRPMVKVESMNCAGLPGAVSLVA